MSELALPPFPLPLASYGAPSPDGLLATLVARIAVDPFNLIATAIFLFAVCHTFASARFMRLAHVVQHRADARADAAGLARRPSVRAGVLHFFGEIEVVFGLWAVLLILAISVDRGWATARDYLDHTVDFTEPLFVVVIMAMAATRPVVLLAETVLRRVARLAGGHAAAWWLTILTIGPLLGSFITEPAAMTICALLLARQFYDLEPSPRLRLATIGLLFVNVSIGGTLTHFAAPPVLMVAHAWGWDTPFMLAAIGWKAIIAILVSTALYFALFRDEMRALALRSSPPDVDVRDEAAAAGALLPPPAWVTAGHVVFLAWTVLNAHHPVLFIGGFLFFLGFVKATAAYQSHVELRSPLLVGFFLASLVIHGGLQGWWIAPVLASMSEQPLFTSSMLLTAFNDNALITYLATLVPDLSHTLRVAVVEGAVVGGGLTVIANAPNPAGHAVLARFFGGAVPPLGLLLAALPPTLVAAACFRLL
ncbi:MAG: hypothetical protein ABS36_04785 [Acidobacteria bacterium SCN 69-37]|nr:MAG: hypothetical protein ABS36_04785 [Acidobacteria bacterium SCN 69-37]